MMERWGVETGKKVENEQVDKFLQEITSVCKKYGLSISHEDTHGAFVIEAYNEANIDWLVSALIGKSINST
ncbi:MAG: hypothetical protein AB1801_10115 [Chloroflexota bacterium]